MENQNAPAFSLLSILSGMLSWLSLHNAQYYISFVASIVAVVSGIFAIRYYYYAANKLKNNKND
jgi:uncharacterized membrane-anchored protein